MKLFKDKEIKRLDSKCVYGGLNGVDTTIYQSTNKNGKSDNELISDWLDTNYLT